MKNLMIAGALASGVVASAATAAEFTGGYVDLGGSTFFDSDAGSRLFIAGSGELAFSRAFSVQADLAAYSFDEVSETATNFTVHTNFHVSDSVSLGAFYSYESLDFIDADSIGIEGGTEVGTLALEGYVSRIELENTDELDGTLLGARIGGNVSGNFGLSASVDHLNGPVGFDLTRLSLGADYELGNGANIYGEIGSARASFESESNTEPFIGVGLRLNFGSKRGTTFGRRGFFDKLPGS